MHRKLNANWAFVAFGPSPFSSPALLCTKNMAVFYDHTGKRIELPVVPKRIVSLVPSQTELLHYLGLEKEVVGITKFCIHPREWFRSKARVGGTKQLNIEKIKSLQPDLILANKEENVKEQIEALVGTCPVWVSDVNNLNDALEMIKTMGKMTGKAADANKLALRINEKFTRLKTEKPKSRICYLIWRNPYMTVGGDTFIHNMLERCGFENIFSDKKRYPEITASELLTADCQLLFLSSEPYPFRQKHVEEWQRFYEHAGLPVPVIRLVDGEMFSWYGSRLLYTPSYAEALHRQIASL